MRVRTLANNVLWLGIATGVSMVASLGYGLVVARTLGPFEFGRFALVVGVGSWLVSLSQGAGSTALIVVAAEDPQRASLQRHDDTITPPEVLPTKGTPALGDVNAPHRDVARHSTDSVSRRASTRAVSSPGSAHTGDTWPCGPHGQP